jgi:hypothetical protein
VARQSFFWWHLGKEAGLAASIALDRSGSSFLFALLVLGMSVSSAHASVIDFNEIASAPCLTDGASPITSDGFQFAATAGGFWIADNLR